ncbi:gamma-glutamylcyclotransferase family protein [Caulobacter segnis]
MSEAPIRLFSYGTLQQESVQIETFGRLLNGQADTLPGFKKTLLRITDPAVLATSGQEFHPIVTPSDDPAEAIPGAVFEITPEELAAADAYEVDDYKRIAVVLGSGLPAFVYVKA